MSNIFEILRETEVFNVFSDEELSQLGDKLKMEKYDKGDLIFQEGSGGSSMFLVCEGEVEIYKKSRMLTRFKKGEIFGEMALLGGELRSASAVASRLCSLIEIKPDDFSEFLLNNAKSGCRFLISAVSKMSERLRQTSSYLVTVYEIGKVIGEHFKLEDIASKVLVRMIDEISGATGGLVISYNEYTDMYDVAALEKNCIVSCEEVSSIAGQISGRDIYFEKREQGVFVAAAAKDSGKTKGYIIIEKKDAQEGLSVNEEVILTAVASQFALGIVKNDLRKEEEARKLFDRKKLQNL
ncbi:MAG: cyclic nucleotide-binding domain-containing protein [Elusimicrobiota bacterium]